jgi:hypothetical protein
MITVSAAFTLAVAVPAAIRIAFALASATWHPDTRPARLKPPTRAARPDRFRKNFNAVP